MATSTSRAAPATATTEATTTTTPSRLHTAELDQSSTLSAAPSFNAPHSALPTRPEELKNDDPAFLIDFAPDDPRDPRNWSEIKKWTQLSFYLLPEIWAQVISSIFAPATATAAEAVGVSEAAMRTVQAIYLYGLAVGPIVVAPVSEDYGRRYIIFFSCFMIAICQLPCALAGSIALMLPFRFVAGFFAAATFNSIGNVGDLWSPDDQAWGVNAFALAAETGAYLGSVIGGYIVQNVGWRWTFGVSGITMAGILVFIACFAKETRGGVILAKMAKQKRKETGDERWYCAHEREVQAMSIKDSLTETLGRPIWMLFSEPIVVATSLYDGFNYCIIYAFILGFALVYGNIYNFSTGNENLPFFAVFIGAVLGFIALPAQLAWQRRCISKKGDLAPEDRLGWLVTSPLFPISLFWFAWTSAPNIHWSSSVIATAVFGFSSHLIFVAISDYTAACYSRFAASAVGAQSLMREIFSGSFTLFVVQGYQNVDFKTAAPYSGFGTILGIIAIVLSLLPFALYRYGPTLRSRSPFCIEQLQESKDRKEKKEKGVVTGGEGLGEGVAAAASHPAEKGAPNGAAS